MSLVQFNMLKCFQYSSTLPVSVEHNTFIPADLIELSLTFLCRNVLHRPQPGQSSRRSAGLLQLLFNIKTDLPSSSRPSGTKNQQRNTTGNCTFGSITCPQTTSSPVVRPECQFYVLSVHSHFLDD